MLNNIKEAVKGKLRLSDRQLTVATRLAKGAEWWCASGVAFWGGAVVLGLGALGLQALGVGIPAAVGVSTLVFGTVMAAKSVVLQRAFRALHKMGVKEQQSRLAAKGLPLPAPSASIAPAPPIAKVSSLRSAFNVRIKRMIALLPHPSAPPHRKPKAITPANSRLPL